MRQSSGKIKEKRPIQNLRTSEGAASGETVLMSKLLLKTTPPKALVYTIGSICGSGSLAEPNRDREAVGMGLLAHQR